MESGIGASDTLWRNEVIVMKGEQMSNGEVDGAEALSHEEGRAILAPYHYLCKVSGANG